MGIPPAPPGSRTGLGIEIGGTKLQVAVVDAAGHVLRSRGERIEPAQGAEGIRRSLAPLLESLCRDPAGHSAAGHSAAGHSAQVVAAGIGFGGPVLRDRGIVATSFHVEGWSGFPLAAWVGDQLREILGTVPVVLENDANAAALAEATVGAGRGSRVVVYSNVGSGIGAGLVVDGRLYHGRLGGEMELGHLRLAGPDRTLEDLASGWAIDRLVRERVAAEPTGDLARAAAAAGTGLSARLLGPAIAAGGVSAGGVSAGSVSAGGGAAMEILEAAAGHYAYALSHVVHLLNPDVIVLGGGVSLIGEPWRRSVERQLEPLLMRALRPAPPVRLAALGEMVVPVGAALAALDVATIA